MGDFLIKLRLRIRLESAFHPRMIVVTNERARNIITSIRYLVGSYRRIAVGRAAKLHQSIPALRCVGCLHHCCTAAAVDDGLVCTTARRRWDIEFCL